MMTAVCDRAHPQVSGIHRAVSVAGWGGIVLPATRVSGYQVYPVVTIDQVAWEMRVKSGCGPELTRSTLALWESWMPEMGAAPPPSAIAIEGFVSTVRPSAALCALDSLAGYGAGLWLAPSRRPTSWTLREFDMADITVVAEVDHGPAVLVRGRAGRIETARRMTSTRLKEEQLFAWALASGYCCAAPESMTPTL